MKTIVIFFGFICFFILPVLGQVNYNYSDKFSAICNNLDNSGSSQTRVYLQNDSVIIEDVIENQCCPAFVLRVSDVVNDSLYVTFTDTATLVCDCICNFDVRINAGKAPTGNLVVKYNGNTYKLAYADSLVTESKIWSNLSGGYGDVMVECCYATTFLKIEPDTLINTIDEKQILESTDSLKTWNKIGDIKESGKRVYFRDLNNNQGLLYDFGALVGDTVKIVNYAQSVAPDTIVVRVDSIDTVNYFGVHRQRLIVRDILIGQEDFWISGIGSIKGLLNPCNEIIGGFRELLCVYDNGEQIYQNPDRMVCYMDDATGINEYGFKSFKIYPNPSNGTVYVEYAGDNTDLFYSIYNTTGQLISSGYFNDKKMNVNLITGLYFLKIKNKDGLTFEDKLLIVK